MSLFGSWWSEERPVILCYTHRFAPSLIVIREASSSNWRKQMQNHKQTLDRAWRILKRGGEMIVGARGVKTSQENSQNHRVSQGLKQQLGSQHGTDLGPLHVCCVPSSSYGTLNSGNRDCLWLFYWLLGPYSLYRVTLPNINTWGGA